MNWIFSRFPDETVNLRYPNNPVNPVYNKENKRIHSSIKFEIRDPHSEIKYIRVPFIKAKFTNRRL